MAIAHRSTSAVTFGVASFNVAASSPSVGDMMILLVAGKPYNSAVSTAGSGSTGEWNFLGTFTDGTVAAGVDVGSMFVSAWWMVYDGTNATVSVVEGTPAWNVVGALVMTFSKGASENWDTPAMVGGGDATAGTDFSVTAGSISLAAGDHTVTIGAFRSDAATPTSSSTRPTLSGITFSHTVDPSPDPETTTGGDMGMSITRSSVFSGSATGTPTLAATLAAAHTGAAGLIRLRVTAGGTTFPQALNATVTTSASIVRQVNKRVNATVPSLASIAKQVSKNITATAPSTAAVVKRVDKPLTATVTSTATLLAQKVILQALTATVTAASSIARRVDKILSATAPSTASVQKQVNKPITATVISTASIQALKVIVKALTATVTTSASIVRSVSKSVTATVTSTASVVRQVSKRLTAAATSTASVQKQVSKALTAAASTAASITKRVDKLLSAPVTVTASAVKQVNKIVSAAATATGDLARVFIPGGGELFFQALTATVNVSSSLAIAIGGGLRRARTIILSRFGIQ